ncbi:hypothetical protein CspHIS471_0604510 [Cutaneotrichosporon sp. HIS471]|nr:hypothetical protein CspHIS471_0604510 [Cutaneotrichosporon sp. HIS471]
MQQLQGSQVTIGQVQSENAANRHGHQNMGQSLGQLGQQMWHANGQVEQQIAQPQVEQQQNQSALGSHAMELPLQNGHPTSWQSQQENLGQQAMELEHHSQQIWTQGVQLDVQNGVETEPLNVQVSVAFINEFLGGIGVKGLGQLPF